MSDDGKKHDYSTRPETWAQSVAEAVTRTHRETPVVPGCDTCPASEVCEPSAGGTVECPVDAHEDALAKPAEVWTVKRVGQEYGDRYAVTIAEFATEAEAEGYIQTNDPDFIGDHFEIERE